MYLNVFIYMPVVLQRKKTEMYPIAVLYTYWSMYKQYVEGIQVEKKSYLKSVGNITMWLYGSLARLRVS